MKHIEVGRNLYRVNYLMSKTNHRRFTKLVVADGVAAIFKEFDIELVMSVELLESDISLVVLEKPPTYVVHMLVETRSKTETACSEEVGFRNIQKTRLKVNVTCPKCPKCLRVMNGKVVIP